MKNRHDVPLHLIYTCSVLLLESLVSLSGSSTLSVCLSLSRCLRVPNLSPIGYKIQDSARVLVWPLKWPSPILCPAGKWPSCFVEAWASVPLPDGFKYIFIQIYHAAETVSGRTTMFGPAFTVDEGKKKNRDYQDYGFIRVRSLGFPKNRTKIHQRWNESKPGLLWRPFWHNSLGFLS